MLLWHWVKLNKFENKWYNIDEKYTLQVIQLCITLPWIVAMPALVPGDTNLNYLIRFENYKWPYYLNFIRNRIVLICYDFKLTTT